MIDLSVFTHQERKHYGLDRVWLAPNDWLGASNGRLLVLCSPELAVPVSDCEAPASCVLTTAEAALKGWPIKAPTRHVSDLVRWLGVITKEGFPDEALCVFGGPVFDAALLRTAIWQVPSGSFAWRMGSVSGDTPAERVPVLQIKGEGWVVAVCSRVEPADGLPRWE